MKKKDLSQLKSLALHASASHLEQHFPNLATFMTTAVFEDTGARRDAPSVTFWCDGGLWKVSVKDKEEGLVLWLNGETVLDVLQTVELFILEPEAPWRHDVFGTPNKGKRLKGNS